MINLVIILSPLSMNFALFNLQGSRWTIQASHMNGDLGFVHISPDQMQMVGPMLQLIVIPSYQLLNPLLNRIGLKTPLQRLCIGMFISVLAVIASGLLELQIADSELAGLRECQLTILNGDNCHYKMNIIGNGLEKSFLVGPLESHVEHMQMKSDNDELLRFFLKPAANECKLNGSTNGEINLRSGKSISLFLASNEQVQYEDDKRKSSLAHFKLRILTQSKEPSNIVDIFNCRSHESVEYRTDSLPTEQIELIPSEYEIRSNGSVLANLTLRSGGVGTVIINGNQYRRIDQTNENIVHMFWQIPQYLILALGSAFVGVSSSSFTYIESPKDMRTLTQSALLMTVAFGHVIDSIIVMAHIFNNQAYEFFFFAALGLIACIVFMFMAHYYKRVDRREEENVKREAETEEMQASYSLHSLHG